jgi:hypothetical protein
MALTVGDLLTYLVGFPSDTPIVVDVNTDEGIYLSVDDSLSVTSDQGPSEEMPVEVVLSWDPEPGWVQILIANANETRADLGLPPLAAG